MALPISSVLTHVIAAGPGPAFDLFFANRTKMFHVKNFGTIDDCAAALLAGAAQYETGIWRKLTSGIGFKFGRVFF